MVKAQYLACTCLLPPASPQPVRPSEPQSPLRHSDAGLGHGSRPSRLRRLLPHPQHFAPSAASRSCDDARPSLLLPSAATPPSRWRLASPSSPPLPALSEHALVSTTPPLAPFPLLPAASWTWTWTLTPVAFPPWTRPPPTASPPSTWTSSSPPPGGCRGGVPPAGPTRPPPARPAATATVTEGTRMAIGTVRALAQRPPTLTASSTFLPTRRRGQTRPAGAAGRPGRPAKRRPPPPPPLVAPPPPHPGGGQTPPRGLL